jgi:hypothetical protein
MRTEAVACQHPWLPVSSFFGLGIKHKPEPLQADLGVGESRFGARIVPSGGGERGPVASMGARGPDDHGVQTPTICRYAFDRCHHCSLDTRPPIGWPVVLTDKDFSRGEHR